LKPVGVKDHLAGKGDENDQQDKSAPTSGAGCAFAKPKSILKPIEYYIQHQEFK
jgi:hypothetical protein